VINLHYDKTQVDDFRELLANYPDKELPAITRSTVPLLAYWKSYNDRVPNLLGKLFATAVPSANLHFELTIPSAKIGSTKKLNRPSQTDLMIFANNLAVAIEAKWTEPRYPVVAEWLGPKPTSNKLTVIDHWLAMISRHTGTQLDREAFTEIVYQAIHRAASACHQKADQVALVYQVFGKADAPNDTYVADLQNFYSKIGQPRNFRFYLLRCDLEPSQHFRRIQKMVTKRGHARAQIIREALRESELFRFQTEELIEVE